MGNYTIILKFKGIDSWNRPVFENQDLKGYFYGDTENLFSYTADRGEVLNFYILNPEQLKNIRFFGNSFDCEPEGSRLRSDIEIKLI